MVSYRILCFLADDYEDLEVQYPRLRLLEAGFHVTLAAPAGGAMYRGKHGYPQKSDVALAEVEPARFDGLLVPGGWLPDKLRRNEKVLEITRAIHGAGKLVASICHGPSIDISAKIVQGFRYTSTPAIKDDLVNAGALWSDEPMVLDRNRVSSRRPDDLPAFMQGILAWFAERQRA